MKNYISTYKCRYHRHTKKMCYYLLPAYTLDSVHEPQCNSKDNKTKADSNLAMSLCLKKKSVEYIPLVCTKANAKYPGTNYIVKCVFV